MKVNKKPTIPDTHSLTSLSESIRELSESINRVTRTEMLRAALSVWPHSLEVDKDGKNKFYMDSGTCKFRVCDLLEVWSYHSVPAWIDREFHETEESDHERIFELLRTLDPDSDFTLQAFMMMLIEYFDHSYPLPKAEPFYTFSAQTMEQKDYFLPALKVLRRDTNGVFWSPVYHMEWKDNELQAIHSSHTFDHLANTNRHLNMDEAMGHCDCGIYGSVNMTELHEYMHSKGPLMTSPRVDFDMDSERLCIIEPFSEATVWLARKGWKSSKAFISEVVGETIEIKDASELLSMVWQRPMDLASLYIP